MSEMPASRIAKRLLALQVAIESRDWVEAKFHYENVVRGVGRLVSGVEEARLPDEEAWEPLQRATHVPMSEQAKALIRARGGDEKLIEELDDSELWKNAIYTVSVTRWDDGGQWHGAVQELSIRRNDRQPVHDWRHFQQIKTELAGAEVEALEMYPAESRLMDTANQYYVYCLPPGRRIEMGYLGPRNVVDADQQEGSSAVQRALPAGWSSTFEDLYATGPAPE